MFLNDGKSINKQAQVQMKKLKAAPPKANVLKLTLVFWDVGQQHCERVRLKSVLKAN